MADGLTPEDWALLGLGDGAPADEPQAPRGSDDFSPDSAAREIALTVLGAAALARRAFPGDPGTTQPLEGQILVALALVPPGDHEHAGETIDGLAHLLAVEAAAVGNAIAVLMTAELVFPNSDGDQWSLTARGREEATQLVRDAARFVAGPPPSGDVNGPPPRGR